MALHPTHRLLASALDSGALQLHVYDACDGTGSTTLQLLPLHILVPSANSQQPCTAACFLSNINSSSDSNSNSHGWVAAGGAGGGVSVWDVETGAVIWSRENAHSSRVKCATAVGPQLLATGDCWGRVNIWDVRSRAAAAAGVQLPAGGAATCLSVVEGKVRPPALFRCCSWILV